MPLSLVELNDAVSYNEKYAASVGWINHYDQVLRILGFHSMCPTAPVFAQGVADWQKTRTDPDGKLGPKTWDKMQSKGAKSPTGGASKTVPEWLNTMAKEPISATGTAPWFEVALAEKKRWAEKVAGFTPSQAAAAELHMSRDEGYFMASPYFGGKRKPKGTVPRNKTRTDWCAAFVNWCLHRAGYSHTGHGAANSFTERNWWRFESLDEPRQGCVICLGGSRAGHVTFLDTFTPIKRNKHDKFTRIKHARYLGGNQGQTVKSKSDPRSRMIVKDFAGNKSPYLWPLVGEANCNCMPGSVRGHFCKFRHPAA